MDRVGMALLLAALAGCATTFTGSATVPKGPTGCKAVCDGWGMELAGMVKMGEYSDGCICQVKPKAPAAGQAPASEAPVPGSPSAAVIPAAAGVYMQMAAAAAAQQASMGQRQTQATQHPYLPHSPIGSPGWRPGLP